MTEDEDNLEYDKNSDNTNKKTDDKEYVARMTMKASDVSNMKYI